MSDRVVSGCCLSKYWARAGKYTTASTLLLFSQFFLPLSLEQSVTDDLIIFIFKGILLGQGLDGN